MLSRSFENEFLKNLDLLDREQQNKVLSYIQSLLKKDRNSTQQALLQFAGSIDPNDVQKMIAAIGDQG